MMRKDRSWYCVRQRAGDLVKESRALRPRLRSDDSPYERVEKNKILAPPLQTPLRRSPVDRVEMMLALMGRSSSVYALTFDDDHLPGSYREVRRELNAFLRRMRRACGGCFDYIYVVEGKHGDHRWHIHIVLRDFDFSPDVVVRCWARCPADSAAAPHPVPLIRSDRDSYFRMARYLTKERTDGIVLPIDAKTWGCSRGLYARLPPAEVFRSASGSIRIPRGAVIVNRYRTENSFGVYNYVSYLMPEKINRL